MRSTDLATIAYIVKKLGFDSETIELVKKYYSGELCEDDQQELSALVEFINEELEGKLMRIA